MIYLASFESQNASYGIPRDSWRKKLLPLLPPSLLAIVHGMDNIDRMDYDKVKGRLFVITMSVSYPWDVNLRRFLDNQGKLG